ncbi:hypothetical protein C8A03DRAFT_38320 [Achaetomium macrosporum]|uniref:Uncharacterized protein n=1 Tax=Achaetomium macrosporum TaxID=79813 RepID=A0AAN7C3R8_9PEZI|nr:hypothetical protein C8A03DRAFT_38320 [Achaetomium macrosporum]
MGYCVSQYRAWPRRWVLEATTPFIHPLLYAGSRRAVPAYPVYRRPSRDAFAVSAAYTAKNAANGDMMMQLVESKTNALLYSPEQSNWSIMWQLAALQALLIYQMIRLFDGEIRQRVLVEAVEPVQAAWTAALQARVGGDIFQGWKSSPPAWCVPLESFDKDAALMVTSPFVAAGECFKASGATADGETKRFIMTGNIQPKVIVPLPDFTTIGVAKAGAAYWVVLPIYWARRRVGADQILLHTEERTAEGTPSSFTPGGESHAEMFLRLARGSEDLPSYITFVNGQYHAFE